MLNLPDLKPMAPACTADSVCRLHQISWICSSRVFEPCYAILAACSTAFCGFMPVFATRYWAACAASLHVVHYNSALRSCRMKPPQRVHAVLWFRGTLRIPDERQSSRVSKPRAPLERERSHVGGGSDGACHYGDIDSREFVALNGEFLRSLKTQQVNLCDSRDGPHGGATFIPACP